MWHDPVAFLFQMGPQWSVHLQDMRVQLRGTDGTFERRCRGTPTPVPSKGVRSPFTWPCCFPDPHSPYIQRVGTLLVVPLSRRGDEHRFLERRYQAENCATPHEEDLQMPPTPLSFQQRIIRT